MERERNLMLDNADRILDQVTDYLLKRGFNRTEEIFRQESKHLGPDGKPLQQLNNLGPKKYAKAFNLLKEWVENNLEIYKVCPCLSLPGFSDMCSSSCRNFCGQRLSIRS